MSKKMKGFALDSSSYGADDDAKTRIKHQTLMQDYQELHKESEAMRDKLETMKHRKLTLLAEVRFLRRRYKYLLENKSPNPLLERQVVQQQKSEIHRKNSMMIGIYSKKEAALQKLPPIFDPNKKGRMYTGKLVSPQNTATSFEANQKRTLQGGKETTLRNATPNFELKQHKQTLKGRKEVALHNVMPSSDSNRRKRIYRAKEAIFPTSMPAIDLKQKERIYSGNDAVPRNPAPPFDLNRKENSLSAKESSSQRAPIFDLNQISGEEEEYENSFEPVRIEEAKKGLMRDGTDEQLNDLKLSVCRNIGDGSARVGKRKISWQDPVALRV
ncbi:unnamed protein product [Ilex paraguariensis]|uniref:Uncharacterized protein n=1 Tax=Ilex paraguariensis TaxID=185542 RepID=A0ABC8THV9_9AQUA